MSDKQDVWREPPPAYYDNGVRFGTGWEMIAEIKRLRAALASVVKQIDQHDEHYSDPRCYYQCGWDWDLLSAEAVLAEPQPLPARDQEHDGHDGHL